VLTLVATGLLACAAPTAPRPAPSLVAPPAPPKTAHGLSVASTPAEVGLKLEAVDALVSRARSQQSSALVILKDGAIVIEDYVGGDANTPLLTMSVTKSVVAMAYGVLVTRDGTELLDRPLGDWLPELADERKRQITLRQLLSHTSGLDPGRADFSKEGILEHALAAPMSFAPGAHVQYNNNACDLLAALFVRVTDGEFLDDFLQRELFGPLGIQGAHWVKDRYGVARGAGELFLRPIDVAKLGQLMLDGGTWQGRQILSADWISLATGPGQPWYPAWGHLWWRHADYDYTLSANSLDVWRQLGVAPGAIEAARPLVGRRFATRDEAMAAVRDALGDGSFASAKERFDADFTRSPFDRVQRGPMTAYYAEGWLGQYLVVVPESRIVAVRMRANDQAALSDPQNNTYRDFVTDIVALGTSPTTAPQPTSE